MVCPILLSGSSTDGILLPAAVELILSATKASGDRDDGAAGAVGGKAGGVLSGAGGAVSGVANGASSGVTNAIEAAGLVDVFKVGLSCCGTNECSSHSQIRRSDDR